MRILAVDSSQIQAAVCLVEDGVLRFSETGSVDVSHSEALLPHIDRLLKRANLSVADIDEFAVGIGPGSFTGIRIGCSTVKALAQVTARPVRAFSSLRAIALSVPPENLKSGPLVTMVNAYQGQVFVGWESEGWREDAMTAQDWCAKHGAPHSNPGVVFSGTGAKLYWKDISERLGVRAILAEVSYATAEGIARALQNISAMHYTQLSANYLRPSQAEVKLGTTLAK